MKTERKRSRTSTPPDPIVLQVPTSELKDCYESRKRAFLESTESNFWDYFTALARLIYVESELVHALLTLKFFPAYVIPSRTGMMRGLPTHSKEIIPLAKMLGGAGIPIRQFNSEVFLIMDEMRKRGVPIARIKSEFSKLFLRLEEALELIIEDPAGWTDWKNEVEERFILAGHLERDEAELFVEDQDANNLSDSPSKLEDFETTFMSIFAISNRGVRKTNEAYQKPPSSAFASKMLDQIEAKGHETGRRKRGRSKGKTLKTDPSKQSRNTEDKYENDSD